MFFTTAALIALMVIQIGVQAPPYQEFKRAGAGFYGDGREYPDPSDISAVRIGVLGPAKSRDGLHQRTAIQMALEEANQKGGYCLRVPSDTVTGDAGPGAGKCRFIPYEMVFHEDDGPWGAAARQVVQFAYEDKVWAIIGALDGHHTHLAELVVSKAWVPVISPGATDSSIDYANVPWVFRAVPADAEQVSALLDLAEKRGYRHLVVLSEIQREAYTGFLRFREGSGRRHFPLELHLEYSPLMPTEVIPRLEKVPIDALMVWGRPEPALELIKGLRNAGIHAPILGPSMLAMPQVAENGALVGELTVASPYDLSRSDPAYMNFCRRFQERIGEPPSPVALYSYDVACLLIAAIERAGLNRARIRDRLSESGFEGLTGKIAFNSLGGNPGPPVLMQLKRNQWVRLE